MLTRAQAERVKSGYKTASNSQMAWARALHSMWITSLDKPPRARWRRPTLKTWSMEDVLVPVISSLSAGRMALHFDI